MIRVDARKLTDATASAFLAAGCARDEAATIASALVEANLYGHDSHGIGLVPHYLDDLREGLARAGAHVRVVRDDGALVGMDGGKGFGQIVGEEAMDIAIDRARAHGVCVAGVANSHHLARIGRWAEQCAEAGLASVHFVNVLSRPLVAPWGGRDARLSTDPFCVAVPHAPHPIVLDFATSMIAFGKVEVAHAAGKPLADGRLLDAEGNPTRDPGVMFAERAGALLSFGEHKGFALAIMCEILGGALSGGRVQDRAPNPNPMINNMLSIVFVPDRFATRESIAEQIESLASYVRASPRRSDAGIMLPGEPERATARDRTANGIPLPPATCAALADAGRRAGSDALARLLQ
jgi:hydroxycarboxylate dehydrogenase B